MLLWLPATTSSGFKARRSWQRWLQRCAGLVSRDSVASHQNIVSLLAESPSAIREWHPGQCRILKPKGVSTHLGKLGDWKGWQVLYSVSHGPSLLSCSVAGAVMQTSGAQRSSEGPVEASITQEPSDLSSAVTLKTGSEHIWGTAVISRYDAKLCRMLQIEGHHIMMARISVPANVKCCLGRSAGGLHAEQPAFEWDSRSFCDVSRVSKHREGLSV